MIMTLENVYFLKNREWYWKKPGQLRYMLTDKAPEKAKESYKTFYSIGVTEGYPGMIDEMVEAGIQEYKKLVAEGKFPPQDD